MLEFYPMPTNLNNGGALYPHLHHHPHHHHATTSHHHHSHQNLHGTAARTFLDNSPNGSSNNSNNNGNFDAATAATAATSTTNSQATSNSGNNNICGQQPQQHQLLQMTTTSPAYASCPPLAAHTNTNNNNSSNTNVSSAPALAAAAAATTTSSLAAQAFPNTAAATQAITPAATAASTATSAPASLLAASPPTSATTPTAASAKNTSISMVMLATSCLAASSSAATALPLPTSAGIAPPAAAAAAALAVAAKSSADCNGRTEVGHIKCEKIFEICEGCGQKIYDRYFLNLGDTNWHEQCLACCFCGMQLHHTCYVRNSKPYCKLDYDRLFGIKCAACCHQILPQEMVMRPIPNFIFHLTCFVCYACRLPLQKGEQFMLRDGQLFCFRHDIDKEMYLAAAQHCGFVGLDEDELMRPRDGRRGPKRPRTILTSQQRKQFKASFDQSPKPCRKVREALAKDTGLSVRVVQVWFQNQRAKMKKIQRKAKNSGGSAAGANGGSGSRSGGEDKDKDKDEKCVKQESASGSESGYLGLDSTFASRPLNPNLPFSPDDYPAHSNDSFCSSDLSLDGSNFDQLDDDADSLSLNNLELQSTGSSTGNHNHHHSHHSHHPHQHSTPHELIANLNTSLINPIDKLYLMQSSYFNSEQ